MGTQHTFNQGRVFGEKRAESPFSYIVVQISLSINCSNNYCMLNAYNLHAFTKISTKTIAKHEMLFEHATKKLGLNLLNRTSKKVN